MAYSGYLEGDFTAECGCVVNIDADWDAPRCRCGGGCWDDEGEWTVKVVIVKACGTHVKENDDQVSASG